MDDIDLPVFSFAPNWRSGILETLEWLTDVMRGMLGHEQRRSLRETPRRFFEMTFNPVDNVRSFMALWLQNFAEREFLLPLWHDTGKLTVGGIPGDHRLDFDNTYREFETGGLALLRRDTFSYEVVEIAAQDVAGIDLVNPLGGDWPAGAPIYPLRPAVLDSPETDFAALVSRVGQAQIAFRLTRANPYDTGNEALALHEGYPVITIEPNRAAELRVRFERLFDELDNQIGRSYRRDEAGRAFPAQPYDWLARGRKQHHELRQSLYRLNGRQKAVWMPTFNEDAVLVRDLVSGAAKIDIHEIGYRYLGGVKPGRDRLFLQDENRAHRIVRIVDTAVPIVGGEDRLLLDGAVAFNAPARTTASFVELMRMDQDVVEITHHTDSDGACEAAAAFRAFREGRDPSGLLVVPATVGLKTPDPCGAPNDAEAGECLQAFQTFDGWDYDFRWRIESTQGRLPDGMAALLNGPNNSSLGNLGDDQFLWQRDVTGPGAYWTATGPTMAYSDEIIFGRRTSVSDRQNIGTGLGTWRTIIDLAGGIGVPGQWRYNFEWRHWTQESYTSAFRSVFGTATARTILDFNVTIPWAGHGVD